VGAIGGVPIGRGATRSDLRGAPRRRRAIPILAVRERSVHPTIRNGCDASRSDRQSRRIRRARERPPHVVVEVLRAGRDIRRTPEREREIGPE
jgi:hypothetical protein